MLLDPDQLLAEVLDDEGEEPVAVEGVTLSLYLEQQWSLIIIILSVIEEHEEETSEGTTGLPSQFSCFVEKLPTCMSKQMVDEVCIYAKSYIRLTIHLSYAYITTHIHLIVVTDGY